MVLPLLVLLPFLAVVIPLVLANRSRNVLAAGVALAPALGLILLLMQSQAVLGGEVLTYFVPWVSQLGLNISLRLDGLSFLFALLIFGIGLLVILYARYYLSAQEKAGRFFAFLLLFMGAMLGVVLASNLLLMMIFWELTSLSSFLLIGFWSYRRDARQGARMALAVTGGGGLALLAGVLIIGRVVGSFELSEVLAAGDLLKSHALYPVALVLVLLGVFTKSAQFPFHFWLPHAMAAPTPVSAYLHSATMVKAGVFLLARLYPVLSGTEWWFYLVTFTGLATLLVGAVTALFQHDLKGLLAYSTISHLGLITLLFGLDSDLAPVAAIFHIINHATFKASLFMAAGIIDHETGTRDMRRINGLWKYMPHTAVLAMVASSAMAGVPLLNGFLSKEMFFSETLHQHLLGSFSWLIPAMATLAGVFSVSYSLRFIHDVFFNGEPINLPKFPPHEPPRYMRVPVEVLAFLCLLVGMVPAFTVASLLASAAGASLGHSLPAYDLAIWHGFNMPLLMSFLALLGGILVYALRAPLFRWYDGLPPMNARVMFERSIIRLRRMTLRIMQTFENGSLQRYASWMLIAGIVVTAWALTPLSRMTGDIPLSVIDPLTGLGLLVMAAAGLLTVYYHRQRLLSLLMLSVVGLLAAMLFARFSAPDLALTQLVVEVVTILLMLLVLYFLPDKTPVESSSLQRTRDFVIAVAGGTLIGVLMYAVLTRDFSSIAEYYLANSVSGGGGTNVVNVILVDFRGFDTLGEISVLAITAIAIAALLQGLRLPRASLDPAGNPWSPETRPLMLQVLARFTLPLALLVSVYIFLRGHNEPGGGFVAGLVTSVALVLLQVAYGQRWVMERLPFSAVRLAGAGVLIAGVTGLASWFLGYPFLTSTFGHFNIPLVGEVELASAMAFDFGVYCTVVGGTLLILSSVGRLGYSSEEEL
ncbi:cation:proton antiporter [Thiopseudomonas alkaliphila]|uniref:monovalent cation/H+ antiporter subunit A n=1 Tax=Thiopseudomonas alkaliphila TaxID=1697053 RepID=UPI00069EE0BB|nr:monovalent cation/H+ antiporter subunit A [Thiopseudomonas alkaliphila]AKX49635.1 cation:proton antiporter [Thiopseudomonas alkaliphila]AKX50361.1 cation:proton antiporter [Thiopseudomonas alkaliphila]AKX52478.1 cation:proton antiporter [Thiopseudomonas alkaliphila]AKX54653.1 cation:proton antiporter [Thiopseudomonas alkaliphila]AKX56694.1 cation:proton antiporter [Thiopseudomonas alkaliphila]